MYGYIVGPRHKWVNKRLLNHFQRCCVIDEVIARLKCRSACVYSAFCSVMRDNFDINTINEHPEDYFPFLKKDIYGLWYIYKGYGKLRTSNSTSEHFDYADDEGRKRMIEFLEYFRKWCLETIELPEKFAVPQELADCEEEYLRTLLNKRN